MTKRTYRDALGRTVEIERPPERIVSLVPSLTEALFAFGLSDRVAGVTRFCVEPVDGVAGKPKVGGTKNVNIAAVTELAPDLVLANVEENTRDDVTALEAEGLRVFLTYARTVAEAIDELRTLAAITETHSKSGSILDDADHELRHGEALTASQHPVRTFCPIWRNPWMTIGPDTYIHDVLRLTGAANVFADASERYPRVEWADVAARRPEIALLPDEPYKFTARHGSEVIEKLGDLRIYLVDGRMLCWYGPRIGESLRQLRGLIRGDTGM